MKETTKDKINNLYEDIGSIAEFIFGIIFGILYFTFLGIIDVFRKVLKMRKENDLH